MLRKTCAAAMMMLAITTPAQAAKPDLAMVEALERSVKLPAGTKPLDAYDRYYALETVVGRRMIEGMYQESSDDDDLASYQRGDRDPVKYSPPRKGRRHLLAKASSLPDIADGECSVIHVYWDIATARIAHVECNGRG